MFRRTLQAALTPVIGVAAVMGSVSGCSHVVGAPTMRTPMSNYMAARGFAPAVEDLQDEDDEILAGVPVTAAPLKAGTFMGARPSLTPGAAPKPAMLSMPSPNKAARPAGMGIDTLIMHHTSSAASAQNIGSFFSQPSAKVSSQYVVGKDGVIVQCVDDSMAAWHAGVSAFQGRKNVNGFSIGIEMCNVGDGKDPWTDEEYKALGKLVAYILTTYHIKWDHVTGHKDIALPKGRKDDPAPNFSYERMKAEVLAVDPNAGN